MLLTGAADARIDLFDVRHEVAFRLFNGFWEGCPAVAVDVYGRTLVIHDYAGTGEAERAQAWVLAQFDWVDCIIIKTRTRAKSADTAAQRNATITYGNKPATHIRENGVRYAVDLMMNRDASFYLDTRTLRRWLHDNSQGKTVLNTFAYTGSLGVAAMAGGATKVIHTDRNKRFLNVAKTSYTLNGYPINKQDFVTGDFFPVTKRFNRGRQQFDCVIVDPPFFSTTSKGSVDLAQDSIRLLNKVRPLVTHNGRIVIINNGLFVDGRTFYTALERVCADGYVMIEQIIPIAADFTGYLSTRVGEPVSDPAPFNHTTKIAVLQVQHRTHTEIP